ncbi:MAG: DUF924 domain-containing protein [Xanthomonadales bacterium]|nr:DUF924 domain-containing protein [Gammaproteobacteria bacterium]MBT8057159.1 DUF924 domain-containing protein [Gammaproteobacteria bacterium]NNJ79095.1 DUF924 domain-containing protein [Xanthomonadales bacterium]NNL04012.1 DUF924 domain-containing protein [Xanthomonadales bacterium]
MNRGQPWFELFSVWFGETLEDPSCIGERMAFWFKADTRRDGELSERFADLVTECAAGRHYDWLQHPEGRLAMVIALDQLPRNLYRGTAKAFAQDPYTAALCMAAALTGEDKQLQPVQRAFLYMPLQHFEDLAGQEAGVALYLGLADDTPDLPVFRDGFLPYARQHRDIVARFGRFPHRNQILGRENTVDEARYLAEGAPSFGQ